MAVFTEPKIDCHVHVLDPARFAYQPDTRYRPAGQEIATAAQLTSVCQIYGIAHCLVVGPNSGYGSDNRCLVDAIVGSAGRFKGIAVVGNDVSERDLLRLRSGGVVGIAINPSLNGVDYYRGFGRLVAMLAAHELFLQVQTEKDQLLDLLALFERSAVRVLVDHCGRPDVSAGVDAPAFQALLALGRSGRAAVKISGLQKFSAMPHPYPDTWPFIRALVAAFGLDHCVWGSDWPFLKATERLDYGPLLGLAAELFPDPADRRKLWWETPLRLFGFAR